MLISHGSCTTSSRKSARHPPTRPTRFATVRLLRNEANAARGHGLIWTLTIVSRSLMLVFFMLLPVSRDAFLFCAKSQGDRESHPYRESARDALLRAGGSLPPL